jgi:hypothetical protein
VGRLDILGGRILLHTEQFLVCFGGYHLMVAVFEQHLLFRIDGRRLIILTGDCGLDGIKTILHLKNLLLLCS